MTELAVVPAAGSGELRELWSRFILNHPEAGLGHLPENFDIAAAQGVKNHSLAVLDAKGEAVGVLPLFEKQKQRLRMFPVRELSSGLEFPAHPLCARGLTGSRMEAVTDLLLGAAEKTAAHIRADTLSITYAITSAGERNIDRHGCCPLLGRGYRDRSFVGLLLDLHEDIEKKPKKSCRNAISRALREGCEVRPIQDLDEWLGCRELAEQTLGAGADSPAMHEACWKVFVERGYGRTYAVTCPPSPEILAIVLTVRW
jgi:hypothetical protein